MIPASVLFLCTQNSCRSQMAEGFARQFAPPEVFIASAGMEPATVHPLAIETMARFGIDISGHISKSIREFGDRNFDLIITLCDHARQKCPIMPGSPNVVHWNLEDPAAGGGSREEIRERFAKGATVIRQLCYDLFNRGYFHSLVQNKKNTDTIINALPQGIIGHDLNRKIFLFSREAEKITGYTQNEVLGRDCHTIFDPSLCGGKCAFCDDKGRMPEAPCSYDTTYKTKEGSYREITMTVIPLRNEQQETTGVLASMVNRTVLKHSHRRTEEPFRFGNMIGQDHKMQLIYDLIEDLSDSDVPVIISGESGTGKELIAHAIHTTGRRRDNVFVPVNCGALPEGTLESELFGHVKGAFTGALRDKKGRFELAHTGTLFLDEVGELTLPMQVKLLRVLQHGTFEPVGGEKTVTVDVRVISATNRNLKEMVAKGAFREDLYYRLAVIPIDAPPLRHKKNDIPLLANEFVARINRETGKSFSFSAGAMKTLMEYAWPGNVRQLQNAIQYAAVKCRGEQVLQPHHFPHEVAGAVAQPVLSGQAAADSTPSGPGRKPKLNAQAVEHALAKSGGNKAKAARMLGVGRATLYNFMSEHNGTREDTHV